MISVVMRTAYECSPSMFVPSPPQHNDRTQRWPTNPRLHWLQTAATGRYVYSDTESLQGLRPVNRAFIVKYARQVHAPQ